MLIWDDAQTQCQNLSSDTSSSSLTFFKQMMNLGYKFILADLGRPVTEKTYTYNSVASQQYYNLDPQVLFVKSVTFTSGGIAYPVTEEESQEAWDIWNTSTQTASIPRLYFLRPNFGVGNLEIGFYPKPSTAATGNITVVAEITDKDLSVAKYNTGTIAVTNGDETITGTGTTFTAAMVGRYFNITDADGDGMFYRTDSFTSATVMELEQPYKGTTDTSANYQIAEAFSLPEEMQMLPVYYALAHYYQVKKDTNQATLYWTLYNTGLESGRTRWATKTRGPVLRQRKLDTAFLKWAPLYFPTNVTE